MRYFSHILHDHWKPKNKLHEAIQNMVRAKQHVIIESYAEVAEYISHLKLETVKLHENHPRAAMVIPHVQDPMKDHALIMVYWPGICHLQIIQERKVS